MLETAFCGPTTAHRPFELPPGKTMPRLFKCGIQTGGEGQVTPMSKSDSQPIAHSPRFCKGDVSLVFPALLGTGRTEKASRIPSQAERMSCRPNWPRGSVGRICHACVAALPSWTNLRTASELGAGRDCDNSAEVLVDIPGFKLAVAEIFQRPVCGSAAGSPVPPTWTGEPCSEHALWTGATAATPSPPRRPPVAIGMDVHD